MWIRLHMRDYGGVVMVQTEHVCRIRETAKEGTMVCFAGSGNDYIFVKESSYEIWKIITYQKAYG